MRTPSPRSRAYPSQSARMNADHVLCEYLACRVRLAMIAVIGMIGQELANGNKLFG